MTWNVLRLAGKLFEAGPKIRIFLMNDTMGPACVVCPPAGYDQDLSGMLKELISF